MDWKTEANAVINDIKPYISTIKISDVHPSNAMRIYFELETLEKEKLIISMDSTGFRVCDSCEFVPHQSETKTLKHLDDVQDEQDDDTHGDEKVYETIYSLLNERSVKYREAFAEALSTKIKLLDNFDEPH